MDIFTNETEEAARRVIDTYTDSTDYISRFDLIRFLEEFMFVEATITGEWPEEITSSWPHGGEIGTAIEMLHSKFGNFPDGSLIDFAELVLVLSEYSGPEIVQLLDRHSFDFEWWNDYHFVVRYIVGTFIDDF